MESGISEKKITVFDRLRSNRPAQASALLASVLATSNLVDGESNTCLGRFGLTDNQIFTRAETSNICQIIEKYQGLGAASVRFSLNSIPTMRHGSYYDQSTNEINLVYMPFNSSNDQELEIVVVHELVHSLLSKINSNQQLVSDLEEAYKYLLLASPSGEAASQNDDDERLNNIANQPAWKILREATYLGDSSVGHPWDGPSEMFASTISVLVHYPEDFVAYFNALNEQEKIAVRLSVITSLKALDEAGVDLRYYIQDCDLIFEALSLN